jgi:hypothetical protein
MCPACVAATALLVAGVVSTGGLTALAAKLLRSTDRAKRTSLGKTNRKEK